MLSRLRSGSGVWLLGLLLAGAGGWILLSGRQSASRLQDVAALVRLRPTGEAQLVSIEPLPTMSADGSVNGSADGEMCEWTTASAERSLTEMLAQDNLAARAADARPAVALERPPLRIIRDDSPTFSAVAVDMKNNEIVLQDENLFQVMVYDRMANTPPKASLTEPKRVISGPETKMEFNCGLYIDPTSGDIYSVNNDTLDSMVVFSRSAKGNVRPDRQLHTPHGTYGIAVDEDAQELFVTVQHENAVVVYRKLASGEEKPLRRLEGDRVRLADPHGIAIDTKQKWMFVSNQGSMKNRRVAGSGTFVPPSINVYPLDAKGDTAPVRVIKGPGTGLNWPSHLYVDSEHGELFVANDAGDSILVFRESDDGDAAPVRVLKGPKTQIKNPTGVFIDTVHDELVIANMGNHRATVFPRAASGDVAPSRVIRSGPENMPALQIGNPGSVAYDTKRNEIIVPN